MGIQRGRLDVTVATTASYFASRILAGFALALVLIFGVIVVILIAVVLFGNSEPGSEFGDPQVEGLLPPMPATAPADTTATGMAVPSVVGQDFDGNEVVISEDGLTAYLLGEAERNDVDLLDDVDAVHVVEAHLAYFEAIGAVGPQAGLDDVI